MINTAYEVILRTGTRTPDSIRQQAKEENWTYISEKEIKRRVDLGKEFNGIRAVVEKEITGTGYFLCYVHPADMEQAKEGFYLVEQAPYFGSYINDREAFNRDWAAE